MILAISFAGIVSLAAVVAAGVIAFAAYKLHSAGKAVTVAAVEAELKTLEATGVADAKSAIAAIRAKLASIKL